MKMKEFRHLLLFEREEVAELYLNELIEKLEFEIRKDSAKWQSTPKQHFELDLLKYLKSKI